jgi:hypothetical protein
MNAHSERAPRFRGADLAAWRENGAVLIERFFSEQEIAPCRSDMEALYGARRPETGAAREEKQGGAIGGFSRDQFRNFDDLPFDCSPALNLIALHPALIDLARAALGVERVHLYQAHSWAKFTGEADFDQSFHCDFKNHTLTVPSEDAALRTINVMIYLTDVTDAHGAIHYVPLADSDALFDAERMPFATDAMQAPLKSRERSGAGPAGSIFAYGIDVYHRGTNLTAPGGHRYTLTASYKAAGNDQIGWSAWPHAFWKRWDLLFTHASPEQLACLGVPPPGDAFWTRRTIERTRERWPTWNPEPYLDAL